MIQQCGRALAFRVHVECSGSLLENIGRLHMRLNKKIIMLASIILVGALNTYAQQTALGRLDFPTSGIGEAQSHFLRGVAALHSFWYEEALEEFKASTKVDRDFVMGYWGEAMAYNHPLWWKQDTEAGRKVISQLPDSKRVTPRELAYINAVRILYGEGDKLARDIAY